MSPRRVPIPFGSGLDREVGAPQAPPGSMEDLRDCYIRHGKLQIRRGVASVQAFSDSNDVAITHILGGQTLRGQRMSLVVGYQGDSEAADFGKVLIYQIDPEATVARLIGEWFTVTDPANDPVPTVVTAASKGRAFFAHDSYSVADRAVTKVFDPFTGPELENLTADLNGDGTEDDVLFRGVVSHLDYLFGWGWGSVEDQERAEIVRVSRPGSPKDFSPAWYFIPGSRRDPTTVCVPAGGNLLVLKEAETHVIQGEGRDNFGIFKIDEHFGCLGPRLAQSVKGTAFFWSSEGPRASEGQVSQSVANKLGLKESPPDGLVAEGDLQSGFAQYIPEEEIILFVFGRRAYALSIRQRARGWSYWTFDIDPYSAFISHGAGSAVLPGDPEDAPPTGHAEFAESIGDQEDADEGELDLYWLNVDEDGDEIVEIWVRPLDNLVPRRYWEMETDEEVVDGVADGFTGETNLAGGSSFSIETVTQAAGEILDQVQKVELVSDGGEQGRAEVYIDVSDVAAGDGVRAAIEGWLENVTDAQGVIRLEFYDDTDTLLDSSESAFTDGNADMRETIFTAPTNTEYVRAIARVEATASDGAADGFFADLVVHVQGDAGDWYRQESVSVERVDPQFEVIGDVDPALVPGQDYEIAFRYRRSIYYTSGYEDDSNVEGWPLESRGFGVAGSVAPTLNVLQWVRDADDQETVELTVSLSPDREDALNQAHDEGKNAGIRVYRSLPQGSAFEQVKEKNPPFNSPVEVRDDTYASDNSEGEQDADYYVTTFIDQSESSQSNEETVWVGPDHPYDVVGYGTSTGQFNVEWRNGIGQDPDAAQGFSATPEAVIYTKNVTDGESSFTEADRVTVVTDEDGIQEVEVSEGSTGDDIEVRMEHEVQIHGITDSSDVSNVDNLDVG